MLEISTALAIFLLSAAVAYILVPANKYKNIYIMLVLIAILIRIAIVSYLYGSGTDASGTDGLLYHQEGIDVARQLADGVPFYAVKYSYTWYTVFVGLIYSVFGVNRYIASYINIGFAFVSAMIMLKMALRRYKFINAALLSLAFLYFPNLALWTADSRKESLLIFACFLCWYLVQRITEDIFEKRGGIARNACRIVMLCLLIWFATLLRIYMFIPLSCGVIICRLFSRRSTAAREGAALAAAVAVSAVLIFFFTVNPLTNGYHAISFSSEPSASVSRQVTVKADTVKTIASKRNVVLSIVNFIILPYPGAINIVDIRGNRSLEFIVSLDMLSWYICLLMMMPGIYAAFKKKDGFLLGIMAFAAVYILINGLVVENVPDTVYRYRSVIVGLSLLLIDGNALKGLYSQMSAYMRNAVEKNRLYDGGRGTGTLPR